MKVLLHFTGIIVLVAVLHLDSILVAQQPGHHDPRPFMNKLTEDQRTVIQDLVSQLRAEGSDRIEIHEAVMAQLAEWGIELPDNSARGNPFRRVMNLLNEEQRSTLHALIDQMQKDSASRMEIWEAVSDQLDEWGIEIPERRVGKDPRYQQIMQQLTPEQRRQVRQTVRRMRRNGSSRAEIHQAIRDLLEDFGFELPINDDFNKSQKKIKARNFPNPFNPETRISYELCQPGNVQVHIYNVTGQLVKTYSMGYQTNGRYSVMWDSAMENGQMAPSGIYIYRIDAGNQSTTRRMLLMR